MSVEFTLTGCSLDEDAWNEVLEGWAADRELFEEPGFTNGEAFLLAEGSLRGVLLTRRDGDVDVRLSALASRADWRNAYAVVREALTRGGGTFKREDGEALSADELTPEAADEAAVKDFVFAAQVVTQQVEKGGGPKLPLGKFALPIRAGDVPSPCRPEDVPAVEERLTERVARYATAFAAATMVLGVEGRRVRVSTWAQIPTLIAANVDCVAVQGLDEPVPLPALREVLGDRVEELGDRLYLPELDDEADGEVLGKLRGASMSVERFVAAHGDQLEADTGPAPGDDGPSESARVDADVQRAARAVAECLVAERDLKEARNELLRAGANKDTVDATFAAAGVMLQIVQEEGGFNDRSGQRILESPVPAFVRDAILKELAQATKRPRRSPLPGCACLLILVGLAVAALVKFFG